ncbi:hypothetical protein QTG54_006357 [Skeletonema marinoi]|uniref:Uncharacterized protein n=1 Tax=Skeletonema marinoi TaxID=267567 RepID=A0AAD8YCX7_9STRA|nr:hypothetical protein QTG54_006357 [Skeletonema marinoi]
MKCVMYIISAAAVSATPLLRRNHRSLAETTNYADGTNFLQTLGIEEPTVENYGYKSTADVRAGSCHDNTEPSCRNKDEDGICQGPFTTDGSIRTIAYAAVAQSDKDEGSFTQTYCARADVYADVFDTGYESSVAHAKANLVITFTIKDDEHEVTSFEVEHLNAQGGGGLSGSVIGAITAVCIVVVAAIGFLVMRRRRVRSSGEQEASARPAAGSLS